ncbi:MAG: carbon-nitrogen hydrolase family protein [Rhodospirillales bacterium]|nr:carbon-nitrogen hydrolase family protein [Alphaproteobacteria bacterium]MCB9976149.1 carbon-nitrogen hydrolase family protein [Rhodospirillales bacterium]
MSDILKVACIQTNTGPVIEENLKVTGEMIRSASSMGAKLIATPENTCHMRTPTSEKLKSAPAQDNHPGISFFSSLAADLDVWILTGSMAVRLNEQKLLNRSFLFDNAGKLIAHYDKIHLFDVVLSDNENYSESKTINPGEEAVIASTPWGGIGLSICYDLRFAYLYRDLAKAGAKILTVPAAFTVPTGQAHWEVLLRARAIETGCFVIAPGQTGEHEGGRKTWGHSLIINPWGEILADAGNAVGIITADLDLYEVDYARKKIPALQHDRTYKVSA